MKKDIIIDDDNLKILLDKIEEKIEATVNKKVGEVIKQVKEFTKDDDFLTTKEAAEILECTERSVYYYKETGRLNFYLKGGRIRFKLADLLAFTKKGKSKFKRII